MAFDEVIGELEMGQCPHGDSLAIWLRTFWFAYILYTTTQRTETDIKNNFEKYIGVKYIHLI